MSSVSLRAALPAITGILVAVAGCQAPGPTEGGLSPSMSPTAGPLSIAALQSGPHLVFQNVKRDRDYAKVSLAQLDAPDGPRLATNLVCERVSYSAGHGLCLAAHHSGGSTYTAEVFGPEFELGASIPLQGSPTLASVSADGRYGAATVFLPTQTDEDVLPTRTMIIDMAAGTRVADLNEFAVTRDGDDFKAADFQFAGVTFTADSDRFFASLRTGGNTYLVAGTISERRMQVLRQNVSSPSISMDQKRLAFAKVISTIGPTFRLFALDLATMAETALAEDRSIDDQVVWLDNSRVIYGRGADTWSAAADGSGEPTIFMHDALSPAVVR